MKKRGVIGILGTNLDRGSGADRWNDWRPTVSLCQHEDWLVDRLDLLVEKKFQKLAEQVREDIEGVSPETEVVIHQVHFRDPWAFEDVFGALFDFARAYEFDTEAYDYLVHITTGTHVAQICLYLLTESRHFPAKLLQSSPPRKRSKEAGQVSVIDLDLSKYDLLAERFHVEQREGRDFLKSGIATRNDKFNAMIEEIEHVSIHSRDPMLLTGPTGAGKSQLARRVYELKKLRRQIDGRFVEVNCATIRGDTAMSSLFGHKKGAFTGAVSDRKGVLVEADGGMLFLDEIGELGLDEQAMLLRAIEEKRFTPMGSDREVSSEFQLICGTNRNLGRFVAEGRFRADLLARINLWSFALPGLRERRDDIEPNVVYELERLTERVGKQMRFNKEAYGRFMKFAISPEASWLGNFRDLNAAISRMATMSPAGRITREVVDSEIARLELSWKSLAGGVGGGAVGGHGDAQSLAMLAEVMGEAAAERLDLFDRVQLASVIHVCRESESLSAAGRKLFAVSREQRRKVNDADRLRKYLAKFELVWADVHGGA